MNVTYTGVNEYGLPCSDSVYVPRRNLLLFATLKLDLGWRALSVRSGDTEVAGIQDFGDGHYEAWVATWIS